ncbi:MAG: nitroreductase family protein [Candidatus Kapaibacterium sp.]|jgi:nitroreductase
MTTPDTSIETSSVAHQTQHQTQHQSSVAEFILGRYSPRVYAPEPIQATDMQTLFEAASWAASSSNAQPWMYIYDHRGGETFERILRCLNESNQAWAQHSAALVISLVNTKNAKGGNNRFAHHDVGMSNATLLLQAQTMDIYGRMMGGYDINKVREAFAVPEDFDISAIIALGYRGDLELASEADRERELRPRARKEVQRIAFTQSPFVSGPEA